MRYITFLCSLFVLNICLAQGLKVIEVKEMPSGTDAFHAPVDRNGAPSALVKVFSLVQDLSFAGNVVGDVEYSNNEYKVFLEKGSTQLIIRRPQILPVVVNFLDYGIDEVVSKATYGIKLKEYSMRTKNGLHIDVKPTSAKVYINDLQIGNEAGDGSYSLLLAKGEYICKVEEMGYRPYVTTLKVGKKPQELQFELESVLASLEVNCQTSQAEISVNGEKKAIGSWNGTLPAGAYEITAQLDGFVPVTKEIELAEKDNRTISMPSLKRARGEVYVTALKEDAIIYIDGEEMGKRECTANLQTGKHTIKIKAPFGYKEEEKDCEVKTGTRDTISIHLTPINDIYAKAFAGDVDAQVELCHEKMESSKFEESDTVELNYWYERIFDNWDYVDSADVNKIIYIDDMCILQGLYQHFESDPVKAIKILHKLIDFGWGDDVEWELGHRYWVLDKYEDAILWLTRGMPSDNCGYPSYFPEKIIDACKDINDIGKGIEIILANIGDDWDDYDKSVAFEGIGDIYKMNGECTKAVLYYKKALKICSYESTCDDLRKKISDCQR